MIRLGFMLDSRSGWVSPETVGVSWDPPGSNGLGEGHGTIPDYELADQSGRRRSLSELQGGNPMVLHLSRGGFDPKEHQFVRQLVDAYPEFRNAICDWSSSPPTIG